MSPRTLKKPTEFERYPLIERLVLFLIAFGFWLVLVWPVEEGRLQAGPALLGLVVAALTALVMRAMFRQNFLRLLKPSCWFWGFIYVFVFFWYVVKGGLHVVYCVLHPAMPINPGIVRVRSRLRTHTGWIVLASSITLTPGTLTVDVTEDGVFYVHWLDVLSVDDEEAAEHILRRFEWFIERIFES